MKRTHRADRFREATPGGGCMTSAMRSRGREWRNSDGRAATRNRPSRVIVVFAEAKAVGRVARCFRWRGRGPMGVMAGRPWQGRALPNPIGDPAPPISIIAPVDTIAGPFRTRIFAPSLLLWRPQYGSTRQFLIFVRYERRTKPFYRTRLKLRDVSTANSIGFRIQTLVVVLHFLISFFFLIFSQTGLICLFWSPFV